MLIATLEPAGPLSTFPLIMGKTIGNDAEVAFRLSAVVTATS